MKKEDIHLKPLTPGEALKYISYIPKSVAGSGTQPQVSRCLFASFSALEKEDIHLKPLTPGEVARLVVTERAKTTLAERLKQSLRLISPQNRRIAFLPLPKIPLRRGALQKLSVLLA